MLLILLLAGFTLALPTPETEETDGDVSRKVLGSSVVTSVSVIMDVGNGSQKYFADAVGKPMTKPSTATQLASPINLLNPDRYEFYTFDDSGDLVKRLMTLDEIQGIIASGDGEATNYNSQSLTGDMPEKKVDDIVNNVQNVLKEEMEAHRVSPELKPTFDTPDVTATWNMILPAIFGNSGNNIIPENAQNGATAETIMIEPTTLLPSVNDAMGPSETNQPQVISFEPSHDNTKQTTIVPMMSELMSEIALPETKTENIPDQTDAPIITVEITSNTNQQNMSSLMQNDEAPTSSKPEIPSTTVKPTTEYIKISQSTLVSQTHAPLITTTSKPIISSTSSNKISEDNAAMPSVNNPQTVISSTTLPLLSTIAKVTLNSKETESTSTASHTVSMTSTPLLPELDTSSATHFYKIPPTSTQSQSTTKGPAISTPSGQLSTFFLIQDFKERPESTTKVYFRPSPFTAMNTEMTKMPIKENYFTQKLETTTKSYTRPSPFTLPTTGMTKVNTIKTTTFKTTTPVIQSSELLTTTEENPAKEDTKGYLPLDNKDDFKLIATSKISSTQKTTTTSLPTSSSSQSSTTNRQEISSTEAMTTVTISPILNMSTTTDVTENQTSFKYGTTENDNIQTSTLETITESITENASSGSDAVSKNQPQQLEESDTSQTTKLSVSTTEKLAVTELLNQLLLTTDIQQINSELSDETTLEANQPTSEKYMETSAVYNEPTTFNSLSTTLEDLSVSNDNNQTFNVTLEPEQYSLPTTDANLVSSIEQLISQAVGNPEEPVDNIKESEKINQMMLNVNSKPMSQIQVETATAASALIGTPNTEFPSNVSITDEQVNQAVDSLISQFISQQSSQTTIEDYSTTESMQRDTTKRGSINTSKSEEPFTTEPTTLNPIESIPTTTNVYNSIIDSTDDRNRYEEIDLGILDSTPILNYESKTIQPIPLSNYNESVSQINIDGNLEKNSSNSYTTEQPNVDFTTTTELNQQETKYQSTTNLETFSTTTEKLIQDSSLSTQQYSEASTIPPFSTTIQFNLNEEKETQQSTLHTHDIDSSTESLKETASKSNEILKSEATELEQQNYNEVTETSSEPFLILAVGSSEYPDYTSTENIDISTKNTEYDSTTSGEFKDAAESTAESQTATITQTELTTPEDTLKYNLSTTEHNDFYTTNNYDSNPPTSIASSTENRNLTTQTTVAMASSTVPATLNSAVANSQTTQAFVNVATITAAPKLEKPPELKLISNHTSSTTQKPDMTWTLVSTVLPHKTTITDETNKTPSSNNPDSAVDLVPKPLQGFGLEDSTSALDTDVFQFTELCNELAFSFWSSVTSGISFARSVVVSPFAATSMLAMVFLGARGSTSGEMNEILKLDDMVTFNPHSIFKNVIESIEVSKKSGVATSVFVKELYSDKNKGKLLSFYKERVKQFYDGHVEEINFREINDVIRRRTNLLVKRQTWGKIQEYLKDSSLFVRPPLAAVSANIFQTDCSGASTEGRDGELHFVVLPSIRQRKLIPIPAIVWRSGFLAGYDPGLDATAVAIGGKDQTISTIFVIPGQQGISAPGDGLVRLEARLIESAFGQGAWSRLLRSLIPRPGLEVQIPRFSHKSVINATTALQRMGLKDLFNSNTADLKGLNGVAHELFLSDIVQVNTFTTCGEGRVDETHHSEVYPATTNRSFRRIRKIQHYHSDNKPFENSDLLEEPRDYQRAFPDPLYHPSYLSLPLQLRPRQARLPDTPRLRFDRPFLYFVRHNPTGLIIHMGRFNPRLLP